MVCSRRFVYTYMANFYFDKINKIVRIDSIEIRYFYFKNGYNKNIKKSYMKLQCK